MADYLKGTDIVTCKKAAGGTLLAMGPEADASGKVSYKLMHEIFVPAGRHPAVRFMRGLGPNFRLIPGENVVCFPPDMVTHTQTFGVRAHETGASQTFKVDARERERQARIKLERRLDAFERRERLQQKALQRAAQPAKPEPEPEPEPALSQAADDAPAE